MPRTGGVITRQRILEKALHHFSKNGIDGTSIDDIAADAGIHKSSIFYYFKNKQEIVSALYEEILQELDEYVDDTSRKLRLRKKNVTLKDQVKMEIEHLSLKKDILAVMLAETLKKGNGCNSLFKCARKVFQEHHGGEPSADHLTHEFFTGFLPLITFVVFREKWRRFVAYSDDELLSHFIKSFEITHLMTHPY
jgi:AcrR family transcriptional regulator